MVVCKDARIFTRVPLGMSVRGIGNILQPLSCAKCTLVQQTIGGKKDAWQKKKHFECNEWKVCAWRGTRLVVKQCSICRLWPNDVCMCACLYVWEICNATVRNKNKTGRCFRMARHQARRRLWWKKKANQVKLENEVHIKGRTNVFRFLVFCRLKRKKEAFSLFLFSPVVAPSQKRAMGFLCDACKAA